VWTRELPVGGSEISGDCVQVPVTPVDGCIAAGVAGVCVLLALANSEGDWVSDSVSLCEADGDTPVPAGLAAVICVAVAVGQEQVMLGVRQQEHMLSTDPVPCVLEGPLSTAGGDGAGVGQRLPR